VADEDDAIDSDAVFARLQARGALQSKSVAVAKAGKADKAVDKRTLRATGRTEQINLKVTPKIAEMIRRNARRAGFDKAISKYIEQLVTRDSQ
jgi:hypothetical protein